MNETPPHRLTAVQVNHINHTLTENGLATAGFCPPVFKQAMPSTDAGLTRAHRTLTNSIRIAKGLGAPHIRIFTFYRAAEPNPKEAARVVHDMLSTVDTDGVDLLVETGTRTNTPTIRHVLEFLEELAHDDIGILWDPGNSVFSGWGTQPFPEEYEEGRSLIRHIHVKDPDGQRGYVRLGDGDLPWPHILRRLRDDGYEGWVSLETHWRFHRVLTPEQRDTPWGSSFSNDGFEASVECMQRLREMATER